MRKAGVSLFAVLALVVLTHPVAANPADVIGLRAAPPGPIVDAPDGRSDMELVRFDDRVVSALRALAPEESIRLDGWPVAPGVRRQVVLHRFDVYAPDARIVRFVDGREVELPRSPLVFFRGRTVDPGEEVRLVAWADPVAGIRGGLCLGLDRVVELEPDDADDAAGRLRVLFAGSRHGVDDAPTWTCGQDEHGPEAAGFEELGVADAPPPSELSALASPTRTVVLAFDTDAEYITLRHGGSTSATTTYIASLVAAMTLIYERDASATMDQGVRILQGYTILRPTEAEDPYTDTTGLADSAKLNEFTNYWETNYPRTVVRRALAALLSGKTGSPNSASGIAWISGLCNGIGYSIDQIFTGNWGVSNDLGILAHEVGHNFGARHTHNCTYGDPPIDTCLAAEGGCEPQGPCPSPQTIFGVPNVTGTLMSYCHLRGDSCTSSLVFHRLSVTGTNSSNGILDDITGATCLASVSGGSVPPGPSGVAISPSSGPIAGGQAVTISGSGFTSGAAVSFVELPSNNVFGGSPNAKALTSVNVVNATTITAVTPSATNTGLVDVVVMNADRQTAAQRSGYTYTTSAPAPTLTAINPYSGSTAGGTIVTITGTGFLATPTVTIGGVAATGVAVVNATTLTATTGAHVTGTYDVVVTNPGGLSATIAAGYFYVPPGAGTRFFALAPCRVVETRNVPGGPQSGPALASGEVRVFSITATGPGTCNVPDTSAAVSANVTVTGPGAAGELKVYPGNGVLPIPNIVSFTAGQTRANNAMLFLSTVVNGSGHRTIKVKNVSASSVHVIVDVNGYYQ